MSHSKKNIIKIMSMLATSSVLVMIINIVKLKIIAITLGPEGVGLLGMLTLLVTVSAIVFGLGLQMSGIQLLGENKKEEKQEQYEIKFAALIVTITLSLIVSSVIFIFSNEIEISFSGHFENRYLIVLLASAIVMTLFSNLSYMYLQSDRRVKDIAKVKVLGTLSSGVVTIVIVFLVPNASIIPYIIVLLPMANLIITLLIIKEDIVNFSRVKISKSKKYVKLLVASGFVLMLSSALTNSSQFFVRYLLTTEFSATKLGLYQAAWSISMTYVGFVISAMSTDFFPKITECANEKDKSNFLVNEQIDVALCIIAPFLIILFVGAPYIVNVLYTKEFILTDKILQWQSIGDVFKVISYPLGFLLLANRNSIRFFSAVLIWNILYIGFIYIYSNSMGIVVTGKAYLFAYVIYTIYMFLEVRRLHGFNLSQFSKKYATFILGSLLVIAIVSNYSEVVMYAVSLVILSSAIYFAIMKIKS
ncbi:oligosaccharide flippase family protein [Vibrio sp. 10N.222.49.C12]|uniref:oligosaccharide flippase family protein n=1 Tax=Vibrio sp. 10N.222.49.C12 TaxID=3229614 RepID=UPI00354CCC0F